MAGHRKSAVAWLAAMGLWGLYFSPISRADEVPLVAHVHLVGEHTTSSPRYLFVQRRFKGFPQWRELKALEEYYDDLEDFYDDRDPVLADYYERLENYYEDLRKGRPAALPAQPIPHGAVVPQKVPFNVVVEPALTPQLPPSGAPKTTTTQKLVDSPDARLERAYQDLQSQLPRFTTGIRWQKYLRLPFDQIVEGDALAWLLSDEGMAELRDALIRYDRVNSDQQYRVVTRLPAFGKTRKLLQEFLTWAESSPTGEGPQLQFNGPLPPAEEIPIPQAADRSGNPARSVLLPSKP